MCRNIHTLHNFDPPATNDEVIYPWPIWLAPAGVVLLVLYVAGIGRPRRS